MFFVLITVVKLVYRSYKIIKQRYDLYRRRVIWSMYYKYIEFKLESRPMGLYSILHVSSEYWRVLLALIFFFFFWEAIPQGLIH